MHVAAYSFDESGGTAIDVRGSYDFALTANIARVAGKTQGGIQPATTTAVALPDIGRTAERSVAMWIKGDIPDAWAIEWHDPVEVSGAWGILFNGTDVVIQGRNGATVAQARSAWPDTTSWHHVAGTYGGNTIKLYLDGELADQTTLVGPLTVATNAPSLFGGFSAVGAFDDLRICDTALGPSSIVASMEPVASTDLASAAELAVDATFLARVKAAMQEYGVARAKAIYLMGGTASAADRAQFNLARACLQDPAAYAQQFAWAIGTDVDVDSTVDDDTIRAKVEDVWNVVAGAPF